MKAMDRHRSRNSSLRCRRVSGCRLAGFTLIELLVALVLSSTIFVGAYQIISNLIQYQVRSSQLQGNQYDRWLLTNLLGEIIEKGVFQVDLPYRFSREPVFRGERDRLRLISRAYSENYHRPGLRAYQLFERDGSLWLAYRAYDAEYRSNHEFETETGLSIDAIRFEYLSENGWIDQWRDGRSFPEQIRVSVEMPRRDAMVIVRGLSRR